MTFSPQQRQWFLGLALALTLAATVHVSQQTPEPETIELAISERQPAPSANTQQPNPLPTLALPQLSLVAQPSPLVGDLFATHQWYVEPPAPRPITMARPNIMPAPAITVAAPPPMPVAPSAPPLPFRYMGKVRYGDQQWRYFLVNGSRVHTVKDGDIIDGTYKIEGMTDNRLEITYLPLSLKQSLTIGEHS